MSRGGVAGAALLPWCSVPPVAARAGLGGAAAAHCWRHTPCGPGSPTCMYVADRPTLCTCCKGLQGAPHAAPACASCLGLNCSWVAAISWDPPLQSRAGAAGARTACCSAPVCCQYAGAGAEATGGARAGRCGWHACGALPQCAMSTAATWWSAWPGYCVKCGSCDVQAVGVDAGAGAAVGAGWPSAWERLPPAVGPCCHGGCCTMSRGSCDPVSRLNCGRAT